MPQCNQADSVADARSCHIQLGHGVKLQIQGFRQSVASFGEFCMFELKCFLQVAVPLMSKCCVGCVINERERVCDGEYEVISNVITEGSRAVCEQFIYQ